MLKKTTSFLIIFIALVFSGCQPVAHGDFAIYLLAQDIPGTELAQRDINQLILESEPVISIDDIVSYEKASHIIELTQTAYARVRQIFTIPVRVDGIPFVVCVGEERIYAGAFWTPASSLSFDGVVIMEPFEAVVTTIQISLGYPVREAFTGYDPRADARIMKALEQENRLK